MSKIDGAEFFSLSNGVIDTSNQVRLTGIIETHRAHLVRASDSNEWLRKNFKTAGIWDRGLESGMLTSHPSIEMSHINPSTSGDRCKKVYPTIQLIEYMGGGLDNVLTIRKWITGRLYLSFINFTGNYAYVCWEHFISIINI